MIVINPNGANPGAVALNAGLAQAGMSKTMICTLFGSPQIIVGRGTGEEGITKQFSPKMLALFVYLVVTKKRHGRDVLADLLWSELSNEQARNNLRYVLSDLRQVVGDYLLTTPQTIGFNDQSPHWIDTEHFCRPLMASPNEYSLPELQATLDLHQGEFLAGFTVRNAPVFEEWVILQRQLLHGLIVQGLTRVADGYLAQQNYSAGSSATQRLLALEPWHEAAHRQQMKLLVASGQRTAALAQFAVCQKALADEFGIKPDVATVTLYTEIRAGKYEKEWGWQGDKVTGDKVTELVEVTLSPVTLSPVTLSPPHPLTRPLPHNLPGQLTPLFGRDAEIAAIGTMLADPDYRLLTLVGEGGVGKTRLALAVAQSILDLGAQRAPRILDSESTLQVNPKSKIENRKFPDGVWFVPLASLNATVDLPDKVATAIANAVAFSLSGQAASVQQIAAYLRHKRLLLIFDNCEHLLPEIADFLLNLLQNSPYVSVLVTSRHLLNLQAEYPWRVEGLPTPPPQEAAALTPAGLPIYSSVALFVERAKRADRDFQLTTANQAVVAHLCRAVEGLPLAIELAAALTRHYSCDQIITSLANNYTILTTTLRDLPPNHRSIKAMLDYSWQLLGPEEARVLAGCSIFQGGFTVEAATTILTTTPELLTRLVDQSLLRQEQGRGGAGRFTLHELVYQYAAAQLTQAPESQHTAIARRHASYYIALLASLEAALLVGVEAQQALQSELDNVRTAWLWSATQPDLALLDKGLESLQSFYQLAGMHREAIYLLETAMTAVRQAVATSTSVQPQRLLAYLLCHTAQFFRRSGGFAQGEQWAKEALDLGQGLADSALQGLAYHELARLAQMHSDFTTMRTLAEQAYFHARQVDLPHLTAISLNDLGVAVSICTDPSTAIPHFHQALHALQGTINRSLKGNLLGNLGIFHFACHDYQAACHYLPAAHDLQQRLHDREGIATTLIYLGDLWLTLGAYSEAQQEYAQALAIFQTMHSPYWESWLHANYGHLQHLRGDPATAAAACTLARQMAQQAGVYVHEQWALIRLGHALKALGDHTASAHCYQQAITLQKQVHWLYRTADAHAGLADLLLTQNAMTEALVHVEAALVLLSQHGLVAATEPFLIYLTCYRVLKAYEDSRAPEILSHAYQTLLELAAKIEDETLRRSFLENVVVNRELIALAQSTGTSCSSL